MDARSSHMQDVMQVCLNGHVVNSLLRTSPERSRHHCERCGATTIHSCTTCDWDLPGAIVVPGLQPVGMAKPPLFCSHCGAAFPWQSRAGRMRTTPTAATLENLLRRIPFAIRQLRERHGTRPPFCIDDEHDLEDLVRSLLPLHFDNVWPRSRTPSYFPNTRTDFALQTEGIILTVKRTSSETCREQLESQLEMDRAHYASVQECRTLWAYVFDPQGYLHEPSHQEVLWARVGEQPEVRCVIGG